MNEILAPCGDYDSFVAALNANCDAIYLGLENFSARKRAKNFKLEELENVIKISHRLGVKVFVATNTLILDEEFSKLIELLDKVYLIGCDAFIVQDLGLMDIITKRYKDLELHVSTQANVTNKYEATFFKKLNAKRIVLAREVALDDAIKIKEFANIAVEIFVHGALCVSYSGNCLFSSSIGPRSGNLGDCAQPCRKKYKLIKEKTVKKAGFLLSTKDLCTLEYLEKLKNASIDSLKIEGRLKSKEYVYYTTSIYKKNLDNLKSATDINILKVLYNREFTKGYLLGDNALKIMNNDFNNHQGLLLGYAFENGKDLKIKLDHDLSINDGIRSIKNNRGYIVNSIYINDKKVLEAQKGQTVTLKNLNDKFEINDKILITKDYSLQVSSKSITRKRQIFVLFRAYINYMALEYEDIIVYSDKVFFAKKHPNTIEELNGVLTKTAHSFYEFNITYDISNDLFINNKDLKKLKQIFIEKLDAKYLVLNRKIVNESLLRAKSTKKSFKPQLAIQIENKAQYDVVKNYPYDKLYIRNEKLYQELNNDSYYLVTDRVIENASKLTKTKNLLVSDYTYLNQQDRIIDCSSYLNAYNSLTVKTLINNGAKIVYLSYELSAADILKIPLKDIKGHVGIVLYSKYDVMLTKNNIINKDSPVNFDDHYYLQDEYGNNYPLVNENTNLRIVSYKENNLLKHYQEFLDKGFKNYKIDFTNESKEQIEKVLTAFYLQ